MPITAPVSLTKIRNEFAYLSDWYTDTYDSGSATITAPVGAHSVRIKVWGGGGGGWSDLDIIFGGGAGAGFTLKTVAVTGGSTQFTYSVGAAGVSNVDGGTSTVTSGSPSISLTATGGGSYQASGPFAPGSGSGGDINESGENSVGNGGGAAGGIAYGGGGAGGITPGGGGYGDDGGFNNGGSGRVSFTWLLLNASPNFSSYIRGGSYVPNIPANAAISTTVAGLAMSQFLGAGSFTPFRTTIDFGSGSIVAPTGSSAVTITLWGGGGGGGSAIASGPGDQGGGGGGSGAYVQRSASVTGGSTVFTFSVGYGGAGYPTSPEADVQETGTPGGDTTVSSAALPGTLTAGGGFGGDCAFYDSGLNEVYAGAGGSGGFASGGTTNTPGNGGGPGSGGITFAYGGNGGSAPNGGAGGIGNQLTGFGVGGDGTAPGGGGGGGGAQGSLDGGGAGASGEIWFDWT